LNTALVNAQGTPEGLEHNPEQLGRIFECAIGAELHRQADELYYWRDGKEEVDFAAICGDQVFAIEVKSGRIRRTGGLMIFIKRFGALTQTEAMFKSHAGLLTMTICLIRTLGYGGVLSVLKMQFQQTFRIGFMLI